MPKTTRLIPAALLLLALLGAAAVLARFLASPPSVASRAALVETPEPFRYERIVSMAPSLTETLVALGLADRLAGVTRYCELPASAGDVPAIGGFLDPSYESIVALEPDLVVLLVDHGEVRTRIKSLGLRTAVVAQRSIAEILESISLLGRACDAEERSRELRAALEGRIERVRKRRTEGRVPRVLVAVGREYGAGRVGNIYVAGKDLFYDEIVRLAGGVNAYDGAALSYPVVSGEGLLALDPDVVLDLVSPDTELSHEALLEDWAALPGLRAYESRRVHVLSERWVSVPGPAFVELLEAVAEILGDVDREASG